MSVLVSSTRWKRAILLLLIHRAISGYDSGVSHFFWDVYIRNSRGFDQVRLFESEIIIRRSEPAGTKTLARQTIREGGWNLRGYRSLQLKCCIIQSYFSSMSNELLIQFHPLSSLYLCLNSSSPGYRSYTESNENPSYHLPSIHWPITTLAPHYPVLSLF